MRVDFNDSLLYLSIFCLCSDICIDLRKLILQNWFLLLNNNDKPTLFEIFICLWKQNGEQVLHLTVALTLLEAN